MTVNMLNVKHWKEEQRVIEWDAISYYAYLPAAFIYNDLSLSFTDGYDGPHKFVFWPEKGPDGKYLIKTTMGLSVMWLPFFIAGHITALITGADAGGYSEPYKFFLLISALFYLLTGLIYLRRILAHSFFRYSGITGTGRICLWHKPLLVHTLSGNDGTCLFVCAHKCFYVVLDAMAQSTGHRACWRAARWRRGSPAKRRCGSGVIRGRRSMEHGTLCG